MTPKTDYGSLFLSTGGTLVAGAVICLLIGSIGLGGFFAALLAAYVTLTIANSAARADKRRTQ